MEEGKLISLREAAAFCGLSRSHLKLLARTGKLWAFKVGNIWVTTPEAVAEYLRNAELRSKNPHKNQKA